MSSTRLQRLMFGRKRLHNVWHLFHLWRNSNVKS